MKVSPYVCIALGPVSVLSVRPAFVGPSPVIRLRASQLGTQAEEHLQEMTESYWADLQQKEKELEKHPDEVREWSSLRVVYTLA